MMKDDNRDPGVDAVIAWVDGADSVHRAKRLEAMQVLGLNTNVTTNATHETRFIEMGEIYYCIAPILKYAPFIRRIYIITDNQQPVLLSSFFEEKICDPDRIKIVDHRVIFRGHENALPTFNSLSIETMMWRIPNLAQNFLYFNDDFFLNGPLQESDLITPDDKIRIRGVSRSVWPLTIKYVLRRWRYWISGRKHIPSHFKTAQARSATLIGCRKYLQLSHIPHLLRRSTFER